MIQDIFPHKYKVAYRNSFPKDNDIILIYWEGKILCKSNHEECSYPTMGEVAEVTPEIMKKVRYLFQIDEQGYFGIWNETSILPAGMIHIEREELREKRPMVFAYAGITGYQILKWYQENKFCGKCGNGMHHHDKERAMVCSRCGKLSYPTISPSVIVGVIKDDRILLTKYQRSHSKFQNYALIAGYAEVGESLEDTVRREVLEEVGLTVKNIRYYKSQPWSFTDTILVGYFCEVEGDDPIVLEEEELSEADWFERESIPLERSGAEISLTGEMIEAFMNGLV